MLQPVTTLRRLVDQQAGERARREDEDETIVLFPYDTSREGNESPRIRTVVERLDGDVELKPLSGVPHEAMSYYTNESDALLVTSRRESGPMGDETAAAYNVPLVSTAVGFVEAALADVSNSAVCRSAAPAAVLASDGSYEQTLAGRAGA